MEGVGAQAREGIWGGTLRRSSGSVAEGAPAQLWDCRAEMRAQGGPAASASELIAGEWGLEFAWNQTKSLAPTQDYVPRISEITPASSEQQFVQPTSDFKN